MDYEDKTITCKDCRSRFTWTAGERKFMQELLDNGKIPSLSEPVRCRPCKQLKRERYNEVNQG